MFKTAAAKIAHNSTLPALGVNQDLRPLQDLITAEKTVLTSLQKLSVDFSKAADALRAWGQTEGDDLSTIISASTALLNRYADALAQYASHGHEIRDGLKTIRTREEALADLKRRRAGVMRKADESERKLSRMGPEHKHLQRETETLNRLRDDIRIMDSDIMIEEAAICDFKRMTTRTLMGLKFGGLVECCDKGLIAGECGRILVSEIPQGQTQPGLPRPFWYGHNKIESTLADAVQQINAVQLVTVATADTGASRSYERQTTHPDSQFSNPVPDTSQWSNEKPQPPAPRLSDVAEHQPPTQPFAPGYPSDAPGSPVTPSGHSFTAPSFHSGPGHLSSPSSAPPSQQPSRFNAGPPAQTSQTFTPSFRPEIQDDSRDLQVDDFGRPTNAFAPLQTGGGRFATFPVKPRSAEPSSPFRLDDTTAKSEGGLGDSFSASIVQALGAKSGIELAIDAERRKAGAPSGEPVAPNNPFASAEPTTSSAMLSPPPGAAAPDLQKRWLGDETLSVPSRNSRLSQVSDDDDALLAYMKAADADSEAAETPPVSAGLPPPTSISDTQPEPTTATPEASKAARHVRFGEESEDIGSRPEATASIGLASVSDGAGSTLTSISHVAVAHRSVTASPLDEVKQDGFSGNDPIEDKSTIPDGLPVPSSPLSKKPGGTSPRVSIEVQRERELDVAAAKEVARELDGLKQPSIMIPPIEADVSQSLPQAATEWERQAASPQISPSPAIGYQSPEPQSPPPPTPPSAQSKPPAASHPYAELNPTSHFQQAQAQFTQQQQVYPNQQPYNPYGPATSSQSLPLTPAQAIVQSYQTGHAPPYSNESPTSGYGPGKVHIPNSGNLPPRFQALQHQAESTIPPRFQRNPPSPAPPIQQPSGLPPRFQGPGSGVGFNASTTSLTSASSPIVTSPPGVNLFDQAPSYQGPYHGPYQGPGMGASTPSLNPSSVAGGPAGKIPAGAFRRPRNAGPQEMGFSAPGTNTGPPGYLEHPQHPHGPPSSAPPQYLARPGEYPQQQQYLAPNQRPVSEATSDDQYDYINSYMTSSQPNSPMQNEFAVHGQGAPGQAPQQQQQGPPPQQHGYSQAGQDQRSGWGRPLPQPGSGPGPTGGYGDGRFATNLDRDYDLR